MKLITRAEAKTQGLTRYYTGVPCKHGHLSERRTKDRKCMGCWGPVRNAAVRKWKASNRDRTNQINLESYHKNKNDPDKVARRRAYRRANLERRRLEFAVYRKKYPERTRTRLSKRRKAEGSFTPDDVLEKFNNQEGKCLCGVDLKAAYHIDHVIPLSRGGTNWAHNIQLLCASCNLHKGSRLMEEWLAEVATQPPKLRK